MDFIWNVALFIIGLVTSKFVILARKVPDYKERGIEKMKRFTMLLCALLCVGALAGCGGGQADAPKSNVGHTRSDPAPLGESVSVEDTEGYTLTLRVIDVLRGDAASEQVKAWYEYNGAPPEGKEYFLVHVSLSMACDDPDISFQPNSLAFHLISTSGVENDSSLIIGMDDFSALYGGGETDGWISFTTDSSDTAPLLQYSYFHENDAWMQTTEA